MAGTPGKFAGEVGVGVACSLIRTIFDVFPDGVVTLDPAGVIESCNTTAARLFGGTPEQLIGQRLDSLVVDAGWRGGASGTDSLTSVYRREVSGRRRDGSVFPMEVTANPFAHNGTEGVVVLIRDITRHRMTEDALRDAEERMEDITSNLPVVVFQRVLTKDGSIHFPYLSPSARDLLGLDLEELMAEPSSLMARVHPEDRNRVLEEILSSADTLVPTDEEYRVIGGGREIKWLRGVARPRMGANGDVVWDGVLLDITNQKRAAEHFRYLAFNDPLTGLLNRTGFQERFEMARVRAAREGGILAVLTVGLERFGIINDTLGHSVGDEALKAVGRRLAATVRESDAIARPSGNTFVVLLARCDEPGEPVATVERILACFEAPFNVQERSLDINASVGISSYPRDGDEAEMLLMNSASALRRARETSPGGYQVFDEGMNARVLQAMVLESRLRRALKNEEFVAYFQPQVDCRTGRVVGMEALARWTHARLGIVPPGEFIEVAEAAGMIGDIGRLVMRHACGQVKLWHDAGLPLLPVAVNLSGRQFAQPRRLLQQVEEVLAETGLDPSFLELELTESSVMDHPEETIRVLNQLKGLGVAVSVDDFGTGYSSLAYLKRFPISKLKIDRSFVVDIVTDADGAAIVDAVIAMAHALRLQVVAEGVEEWGQFEVLQRQGCDQIQGFLFSPPLSAPDMEALLRRGSPFEIVRWKARNSL